MLSTCGLKAAAMEIMEGRGYGPIERIESCASFRRGEGVLTEHCLVEESRREQELHVQAIGAVEGVDAGLGEDVGLAGVGQNGSMVG